MPSSLKLFGTAGASAEVSSGSGGVSPVSTALSIGLSDLLSDETPCVPVEPANVPSSLRFFVADMVIATVKELFVKHWFYSRTIYLVNVPRSSAGWLPP